MKNKQISKYVPNFINNFQDNQFQESTKTYSNAVSPLNEIKNTKEIRGKKIQLTANRPKITFVQQQSSPHQVSQNKSAFVCDISQMEEEIQTKRSVVQHVKIRPRNVIEINLDQFDDESIKPNQSQSNISEKKSEKIIDANINLSNFNRVNRLKFDDWTENSEISSKKIQSLQDLTKLSLAVGSEKIIQEINYQGKSLNLFSKIENGKRVRCIIRRDKKNSEGNLQFNIYFQKNMKHVMTVRKQGIWTFNFYLRQDKEKESFKYTSIAILQSTILGNRYSLFKKGQVFSNVTICYETNLLGLLGPRKIQIYLPQKTLPYEYIDQGFQWEKDRSSIIKCVNKSAKWNEKSNAYILNFQGRAVQSSIKNFVISDEKEDESKYWIIFGKASKQVYNLDIQSPFSIIQGIAVAISSFERKLTCD